jgi:hypothetical protein
MLEGAEGDLGSCRLKSAVEIGRSEKKWRKAKSMVKVQEKKRRVDRSDEEKRRLLRRQSRIITKEYRDWAKTSLQNNQLIEDEQWQ